MLPGVGAALLSAYNWYRLRQGANLKLDKIVSYAIKPETSNINKFYFPVLVHNVGTNTGMVHDLVISFKSTGEEKTVDIERRIEFEGIDDESTFKNIEPMFPFFIPEGEGGVVVFECVDHDDDVIPVNEHLKCTVEIHYGHKKRTRTSFPFTLRSEDISTMELEDMKWLKPYTHPKEAITDRDLLKTFLTEVNLEDEFEEEDE